MDQEVEKTSEIKRKKVEKSRLQLREIKVLTYIWYIISLLLERKRNFEEEEKKICMIINLKIRIWNRDKEAIYANLLKIFDGNVKYFYYNYYENYCTYVFRWSRRDNRRAPSNSAWLSGNSSTYCWTHGDRLCRVCKPSPPLSTPTVDEILTDISLIII